jgi:hypothetical protein
MFFLSIKYRFFLPSVYGKVHLVFGCYLYMILFISTPGCKRPKAKKWRKEPAIGQGLFFLLGLSTIRLNVSGWAFNWLF